jgi:hypothetical protein
VFKYDSFLTASSQEVPFCGENNLIPTGDTQAIYYIRNYMICQVELVNIRFRYMIFLRYMAYYRYVTWIIGIIYIVSLSYASAHQARQTSRTIVWAKTHTISPK